MQYREGDNHVLQSVFLQLFHIPATDPERPELLHHPLLIEGKKNGWSAIVLSGSGMLSEDYKKNGRIVIPGLYEKGSVMSGSEGVRVVLHPPGTQPFPLTEGFDVPTGFLVSLGIKPKHRKRVGAPHGSCLSENPFYSDLSRRKDRKPYRQIECQRMCLQKFIISGCGCYDGLQPKLFNMECKVSPDSTNGSNIKMCLLRDSGESFTKVNNEDSDGEDKKDPNKRGHSKERILFKCGHVDQFESCDENQKCEEKKRRQMRDELACLQDVKRSIARDLSMTASCRCQPPCNEFTYDVSYSLSRWPSKYHDGDMAFEEIFSVSFIKFHVRLSIAYTIKTVL